MKSILTSALLTAAFTTVAFADAAMVEQAQTLLETKGVTTLEIPADATDQELAAVSAYLEGVQEGDTQHVEFTVKKLLGPAIRPSRLSA